jgi:CubicO group peptidase (beta-lactamase class C family)
MPISLRPVLLLLAAFACCYARADAQLDKLILAKMEEANMVGLGAALIVDGKLAWTKGYGFADREKGIPFTPDTVMNIGSITKNITGAALLKAVGEGKLSLDEDINRYLPFKVENPYRPGEKITLRHIATHTSSLVDRTKVYRDSYRYEGRKRDDLGAFLKAYFVPGGQHYAKENFLDARPGEQRAYSNIAAGLAGYIVELAVKERLDRYTVRHFFKPLGMDRTSWFPADTDMSRHARLYISQDTLLTPIPHYESVTYPDGGVRSSVNDLSKYFLMMLGGGQLDGKRLLPQPLVEEMQRLQFSADRKPANMDLAKENSGLFWNTKMSATLVGHGGSDPGLKTEMLVRPAKDVGVILFTNTSMPANDMRHLGAILKELLAYGDRLKLSQAKPAP